MLFLFLILLYVFYYSLFCVICILLKHHNWIFPVFVHSIQREEVFQELAVASFKAK